MEINANGLVRFETERLIGREWTDADVGSAFAIYGDPEVQAGLSGAPEPSMESQRENLLRAVDRYRLWPKGTGFWAVERKTDGQVVGASIVKPLPGDEERFEVGWHMARAFWGFGYATESGREAVRVAFQFLPIEVLHCLVRPWNLRSLRVAEKLGFEKVGLTWAYYEMECVQLHLTRATAAQLGLASPIESGM